MSSEQAVCHHRATCAAGFKQCQAQVTAPSPIEGRADLSSCSLALELVRCDPEAASPRKSVRTPKACTNCLSLSGGGVQKAGTLKPFSN